MEKSKLKGNFLRDPQTNILWLNEYKPDQDYCVPFHDYVLDFATCVQEEYEIVSAVNFGFCMASADLIVAKNKKGLYAVLATYDDSMGYGAIYASITPGFTFKSVYGFANRWDNYIVGENEDGKWGIIQITHTSNCWFRIPFCNPHEIVRFDNDSMLGAMNNYPLAFTPWEILDMCKGNRGMGDLTKVEGFANVVNRGNGEHEDNWGITLDEIKTRRRNLQSSNLENKQIEFTPNNITKLENNEVFVFGSNIEGRHGGGAARLAYEKFGAVWGLGVGLAGQSYAIPTMHGGVAAIKPYVDQFIEMAKVMKDKKFYVTKIGCGIAGFDVKEMAPLFNGALELENVALPREFVMELKR